MKTQAVALTDGEQNTQQLTDQTKRKIIKTEEKGANLITVCRDMESSKERRNKQTSCRMHGSDPDPGHAPR